MPTTPQHPQDPVWPEQEDTALGRTTETRVVSPDVAPREPPLLPPEAPPPPPEEGPGGIGYGMLVGIALLLAAGAAIAAFIFLTRDDDEPATQTTTTATTGTTGTTGASAAVAVPDVVGLPGGEASAALDRLGLEANVVSVPGEPPEGRVVAQDPAAGERAAEGSAVRLNVSDGTGGDTVTVTTTVPATTAPAATTPSQTTPSPSPAPGSGSSSPPPAQIDVPELAGTLRPALQQVNDAGLRVRIQYVPGSDPLGTVLAQSPSPGTSVPGTAEVTINVSSGPGDRPQRTVPDTSGQTVNEALQTLNDSGLRLIMLRREVTDSEQGGVIVDQTPAAGTEAPENAQVLVYMGAYTG